MVKSYSVTYFGQAPSLNDWYSGKHWGTRLQVKNKYSAIFLDMMLRAGLPKMNQFNIHILYNSRHDVDNVVGVSKIFVDCMKGKYIKDDTKKYFRGLQIEPDESLKLNTFIITINILS